MELFTSVTVEVKISGAWVDLSDDVLYREGIRATGIGINGNGIMDRTGDAAICTFSLRNFSRSDPTGTLGKYSPGNTNVLSGWTAGLEVRVRFTYDGITKTKYHGWIDKDGIKVQAGKYGLRKVDVTCSGWMKAAQDHTCDLLPYLINSRINEAVPHIVANMYRKPPNFLYYTGDQLFPTVFDITRSQTKAVGELDKLAFSEMGYIFQRGDGTLVVENRNYRSDYIDLPEILDTHGTPIPVKSSEITDNLLLESGDDLLLEDGGFLLLETTQYADFTESEVLDLSASYGRHMFNRARFITYPRNVDDAATTVLWSLENPIEIAAAETLTDIRGRYRDPNGGVDKVNGIEMVDPVINDHYQMFENEDGSGTDYTSSLSVSARYGTAEVEYTLTNNAGVTAYITKLQAVGKGVYIYDTSDKYYDKDDRIAEFGVIQQDIDMPYLSGVTDLFLIADKTSTIWENLLTGYFFPARTVDSVRFLVNRNSKSMMAFMFLEPSTLIKFAETMTDATGANIPYSNSWFINGYGFEVMGDQVYWNVIPKGMGRS